MKNVFFSHQENDKKFVCGLARKLERSGVKPWVDGINIKSAQSIPGRIEEALREADYFVIVLSPGTMDRGWVKTELDTAHMLEKRNNRPVIIPIIYKPTPLPLLLEARKAINFTKRGESYNLALSRLIEVIQAGSKSESPPSKAFEATPKRVILTWAIAKIAVLIIALGLIRHFNGVVILNGAQRSEESISLFENKQNTLHSAQNDSPISAKKPDEPDSVKDKPTESISRKMGNHLHRPLKQAEVTSTGYATPTSAIPADREEASGPASTGRLKGRPTLDSVKKLDEPKKFKVTFVVPYDRKGTRVSIDSASHGETLENLYSNLDIEEGDHQLTFTSGNKVFSRTYHIHPNLKINLKSDDFK